MIQRPFLIYLSHDRFSFVVFQNSRFFINMIAVGGAVATSQSAGSGPALAKPAKVGSGPGVVSRPLIEDYQLPPRYQRRPLDINEIDYINVSWENLLIVIDFLLTVNRVAFFFLCFQRGGPE